MLKNGFLILSTVGLVTLLAGATSSEDRIAAILRPTTDFSAAERYEAMQGGAATSEKQVNADAFSQSSANLTFEQELDFKVGNAFFKRLWVTAPASTKSSDGLGPIYNARSCQLCHLKDGRGHPPTGNAPEDNAVSMFLRLSIPPQTDAERQQLAEHKIAVVPEPTYGGQLQDFSILDVPAEGLMHIDYTPLPVTLGDGTVVELRKPSYSVTDLGYGPMHPDAMLSPRVAPQMPGLGLLEMIAEDDILKHADPEDADGDGISGRAQQVWDNAAGAVALGRFGWKAGNPSIRQQSAGAFAGDIGISNPMAPDHWGDCTLAQATCRAAPDGREPGGSTTGDAGGDAGGDSEYEAPEEVLSLVTFYSQNLAVPKRRDVDDPTVLAGKQIFYSIGCPACHVPKFVTRTDATRKEHSHQLIWPYTDLLLHDMGDGLADNRPEGVASGSEWRTAPLWGIGLTEVVNGHTFFLHDGRARNLQEAILWHGGEAEAAKEAARMLSAEDWAALLAFLNSL